MATSFDLGGLLGNALGGSGALDDLLTPEQRAAIQRQGALSAAAALLQAAGPSTTRTTLGQALGSAFTAGQAGMQKGQESALTQMLTRQKLEEAKRGQTLQANIAKILTGETPAAAGAPGGEITPEEALAAPRMPAGPTVARAGLIGQPRPEAAAAPALNPNELKARQYRQIADVYAASGKGEEAKRFMDIADALAPTRQEVIGQPYRTASGEVRQALKNGGSILIPAAEAPAAKATSQPFEVTDVASGKPILVQYFDDNTIKPLEGYGPKRDMVLQGAGDRILAIDKTKLTGGETFRVGLAPQIVGGAETGYFQVGGGGGRAAVPAAAPAAGGAPAAPAAAAPRAPAAGAAPGAAPVSGAVPIIPGTGAKAPEAFMKAARQLNDLTGQIADYKNVLSTTNWVLPKNIPIPFTDNGISLPVGSDTAAVSSRYNALLMGVKNLYELGALTGPDMSIIERQITNPASFSGLLTSRGAMNEQVKVLEDMLARAKTNLESSYKQKVPEAAAFTTPQAAASAPAFREGATSTSASGRPIVFRNGQWVFQ